jgi:hypothetical protein
MRGTLFVFLTLFALGCLAQNLDVTVVSWDTVGLDSNDPSSGPTIFLVGVRACNTGSSPLTNVRAQFDWCADSLAEQLAAEAMGNPYCRYSRFINVKDDLTSLPPLSETVTLAPMGTEGDCFDFYFNIKVDQIALAFGETRTYSVTISADGQTDVKTQAERQILVEKIVSQNRNGVNLFTGPETVVVGGTYQYELYSETATQGYPAIENFPSFEIRLFQLLKIETTYSSPVGGTNDVIFANAACYDQDPTSATYREFLCPSGCGVYESAGCRAGGVITSVYTVKILSTGEADVSNLVYDLSGSSYHYNAE